MYFYVYPVSSQKIGLPALISSHPTLPSTAPSDLAQQRDAKDVLQQKRDGADG